MADKPRGPEAVPEDIPLDERIRDIICENLSVSPDEVTSDASFVDDLNADSLDIQEMNMALEETFDIEISTEDEGSIQTVGDAVAFIRKRLAG